MDSYAINVINSIIVNPDTNRHIQEMKRYISDPDAFHGHMNNFVSVFQESISKKTLSEIIKALKEDDLIQEVKNKIYEGKHFLLTEKGLELSKMIEVTDNE